MSRNEFRRKSKRRGYLKYLAGLKNLKPSDPRSEALENTMPIPGGYTDPNRAQGDFVLLPADKHACVLLKPVVTTGTPHPQSQAAKQGITSIDQLQWTFEGLQFKGPVGEDGKPKRGVVSLWTGFNYGDPKAKLTHLMNAIFGRQLTQEEARRMDYEKFAGIKGWVMVSPRTKQDGSQGTQFAGFMWPDGAKPPKPEDFFLDQPGTPAGSAVGNASAPLPDKTNPFEDGGADADDGGDPFE